MAFGPSGAAAGPLEPGSVSVLLQAARQANTAAYKIVFIRDFVDVANRVCKNRGCLLSALLNVFKIVCLYRENTMQILLDS